MKLERLTLLNFTKEGKTSYNKSTRICNNLIQATQEERTLEFTTHLHMRNEKKKTNQKYKFDTKSSKTT